MIEATDDGWYPTMQLRFVLRDLVDEDGQHICRNVRILQQMWKTNRDDVAWHDVPLAPAFEKDPQ